jgi:hypothetical protein
MKNTSALKYLSLAFLTAMSLTVAGAQAQTQPQAIRLREIKDLDKLDPNWIMGMCNLPGLECNKVEVPRLFERKTDKSVEYYATLEGLALARLTMNAPGQWQLLNRWSFTNYPLTPRKDEEKGSTSQINMHPALYPVGPDQWAIAVLTDISETYSGGWASFTKADFVLLDSKVADIGEKQRLLASIPFSCQKAIRACFSEKDYKTSANCHEESSGYLTLKVALTSAGAIYDWTATWHETVRPGGTPKATQTKTQKVATLKLGAQGAAPDFPFCEGGPAQDP